MERALADLSFPTAFVRAGSFYDNYASAVSTAQHTGKYFSFQPVEFKYPMVGTVDIGNEVGKLLLSDWSGKRIIELGSLKSADQIAVALSKVVGQKVEAQAIPQEAWAQTLQQFGMPAGSTGPYEQMMESINNGWIAFCQPDTEPVAATQTPEEFFSTVAKK